MRQSPTSPPPPQFQSLSPGLIFTCPPLLLGFSTHRWLLVPKSTQEHPTTTESGQESISPLYTHLGGHHCQFTFDERRSERCGGREVGGVSGNYYVTVGGEPQSGLGC